MRRPELRHRPPQIILTGLVTYFISSRTYGGIPHLAGEEKKRIFKEILFQKVKRFSGKIKNWIVFSNHYHLLAEFSEGRWLSTFIKELHGASSFAIKKLPLNEVLNEDQIVLRSLTPMEERMARRVGELWRRLKPATTSAYVLADFLVPSPSTPLGINSIEGSPHNQKVLANFSSRLEEIMKSLNFSEEVRRRLKSATTIGFLIKSLSEDNLPLFKTLVFSNMSDIPFWSSYYSHVIRDEKDYFRHFNYISQNPIKHGLAKNVWDYKFSGVFKYEKDYVLDALRRYPIVDFGGSYD